MRWVGWTAVVGLLAATFVAPASVSSKDVPGNNGTVKIHEGSTETEPIVRNQPHVCTFHLHFFFADPSQAGTWEIQEWSPGDKGVVVLDGDYDTNGDGEDREPNNGAYSLPEGHYKLFWDGDLDTDKHDKHKVFWVDCAETAPPTFEQSVGAETDAPETGTPPPSFRESAGGETDVPGTGTTPPSFQQSVGGETDVPGGPATQPPTDTEITAAPNDASWRWMLVIIASLLASVLVMTPKVRAAQPNR